LRRNLAHALTAHHRSRQRQPPTGPYYLDDARHRLQSGEFRADQLAHADGPSDWTRLSAVIAYVEGLAPTPPPYVPFATAATPTAPTSFAGFWLRLVAYVLDTLVVGSVVYGVILLGMLALNPQGTLQDLRTGSETAMDGVPFWFKLIMVPFFVGTPLLYFSLMESGPKQASLGKMVVGAFVTDLRGARLSFWHAFSRTAAKMITNFTCIAFYIGYIMAGFTERKQALHDIIASTLVLKR
jgi:uncharacterized RDD family membrane protein YckC